MQPVLQDPYDYLGTADQIRCHCAQSGPCCGPITSWTVRSIEHGNTFGQHIFYGFPEEGQGLCLSYPLPSISPKKLCVIVDICYHTQTVLVKQIKRRIYSSCG